MMTTGQERKIRQVLADLATNVEAATKVANVREAQDQRRSAIALAFGQIAMIMEPYEGPGPGTWMATGEGWLPAEQETGPAEGDRS